MTYIPYNQTLTPKARANRKAPTLAEQKMWLELLQGKKFLGLRFSRQKPIDEYIVDFYCSEYLLAIEIDGDSHAEQKKYDQNRTEKLNTLGVIVIRYTNEEVINNIQGVYEDLNKRIDDLGKPPQSPLSGRG